MLKRGVWHDPKAAPRFYSYRQAVDAAALRADGVILDEATGVYWNWQTAGAASEIEALNAGYRDTPGAHQRFGDQVYAGFRPGRLAKSGFFELYSPILEAKGLAPLPSYAPVPEHQAMKPDELILTTFRVNVQTLSRTQNCMWLDEIDVDDSAWINPKTAASRGIADGERIRIATPLGEIEVSARVTEAAVPGIVALSSHGGRWEYGRYASGKKAPTGIDEDAPHEELKWWRYEGAHPNRIIPISSEPISGQQRWMDTVVSVTKA
jgi:anaerobic selenocysteine-containing dehydrogenase